MEKQLGEYGNEKSEVDQCTHYGKIGRKIVAPYVTNKQTNGTKMNMNN